MKEPYFDKHMSYYLIKHMFEHGVYSAKDLLTYVDMGNITKDEYHFITGYNYDGYKSVLEKEQKNGGHL